MHFYCRFPVRGINKKESNPNRNRQNKENVLKTLITDLQGEEAMKQQGEETTHICLTTWDNLLFLSALITGDWYQKSLAIPALFQSISTRPSLVTGIYSHRVFKKYVNIFPCAMKFLVCYNECQIKNTKEGNKKGEKSVLLNWLRKLMETEGSENCQMTGKIYLLGKEIISAS